MHLFGGKFCTKTDGSGDVCSCPDLLRTPSMNSTLVPLNPSRVSLSQRIQKGVNEFSDNSNQMILDISDNMTGLVEISFLNATLFVTRTFEVPFCVCDRKNFNNFLWATLTVFQVIGSEIQ
jgi:hypothetical protein